MYILIIMSHHQHGYPWSSPATLLYCPSLPAGLQGYILYRHRTVICRFLMVVLSLLVHVKGLTGVRHIWARPYFSSSVPPVWFVKIWKFSWGLVSGRTVAALWAAASRTRSILLSVFLFNCRQVLVSIQVVHPYSNIDTTAALKKTAFHLFDLIWLPCDW